MCRFVIRSIVRSWLFALILGPTLAACHNHESSLLGPQRPLAVGAYHSLVFGDACAEATDKFFTNFCTTEHVTDILQARSDAPTIADVILGTDHPRADVATHKFYVVGKGAGRTSLVFKGMFDDGSVRESKIDIRVEAVDALKLVECNQPPADSLLVIVGRDESFELAMFAGSDQLAGWLPDAASADGLVQQFMDSDSMPYVWQAPATSVVEQVQSPIVPHAGLTLTAFSPGQVTAIDLTVPSPVAVTAPGDYNLNLATQVRVEGQTPCVSLPVELHSSTPAICSGRSGESVWQVEGGVQGYAVVHAEGTCVLGVSLPGGPVLTTKDIPIFFVQSRPFPPSPETVSEFCRVEGETMCGGDYNAVSVCKGSNGTAPPSSHCAPGQVCDFVPDSTPGCIRGASCARCRGLR